MMRRKTGNWTEDTLRAGLFFVRLGLASIFIIPILLVVIVVLVLV